MGGFEIDKTAVRALAELLDETGLAEIEYEAEGGRIRVARAAVVAAAPAAAPAVNSAQPPAGDAKPAGAVPSPMVGTVYLQAGPGEPSFVKIGDRVTAGDIVAIIEAMKVMNQIPAPRSGIIKAIGVENAQPVEFGETLMVIE